MKLRKNEGTHGHNYSRAKKWKLLFWPKLNNTLKLCYGHGGKQNNDRKNNDKSTIARKILAGNAKVCETLVIDIEKKDSTIRSGRSIFLIGPKILNHWCTCRKTAYTCGNFKNNVERLVNPAKKYKINVKFHQGKLISAWRI